MDLSERKKRIARLGQTRYLHDWKKKTCSIALIIPRNQSNALLEDAAVRPRASSLRNEMQLRGDYFKGHAVDGARRCSTLEHADLWHLYDCYRDYDFELPPARHATCRQRGLMIRTRCSRHFGWRCEVESAWITWFLLISQSWKPGTSDRAWKTHGIAWHIARDRAGIRERSSELTSVSNILRDDTKSCRIKRDYFARGIFSSQPAAHT